MMTIGHFQGEIIAKMQKCPEPATQIQSNLVKIILGKVCSNKGPSSLQRGDNHKNVKMGWGHLKISTSTTALANFNQTWHISSLGEGDSSLFKRRE
jgi:hypothetical protein